MNTLGLKIIDISKDKIIIPSESVIEISIQDFRISNDERYNPAYVINLFITKIFKNHTITEFGWGSNYTVNNIEAWLNKNPHKIIKDSDVYYKPRVSIIYEMNKSTCSKDFYFNSYEDSKKFAENLAAEIGKKMILCYE